MKVLSVLVVALLACSALAFAPALRQDIIEKVNSNPDSTWTAGHNEFFHGKSLEFAKGLLGTSLTKDWKLPVKTAEGIEVPDSFDSRENWPKCKTIGTIRNQARCGSCWAFGATEAFEDRVCIASNQTINPTLSPQFLVTCDREDNGCFGGMPSSAWEFIERNGLPTEACQPYTIPTCTPDQQPCMNFVDTPRCVDQCYGNTTSDFSRYHASSSYYVDSSRMMEEIATNGPVEGAFTVYADFLHYKTGVYSHQTGSALGGHAIKIIGYGTDSQGTPYWNIANSWTTSWGDGGYFKILRGSNECGIEDDVVAGLAEFKPRA